MANVINSLAFQNFYNYYGDIKNNKYVFRKGLNIVVADNGFGKSKFYNGILWLLNDQVYDSDLKTLESIQTAAFKMVSDKAKVEASKGESIDVIVDLVYQDKKFEYRIVKKFNAKKKNNESATDPDNWLIRIQEPEVSRKDLLLNHFRPVYDNDEKQKIISGLIDGKLRRYSLLQGEAIDNIVDLLSRDGLLTTVETLTNIDRIKELVKTAKGLRDRAERELRQKQKESQSDIQSFDALIKKEENLKVELENLEESLRIYVDEFNAAKEKELQLLNRISNATERAKYRTNIESIENEKRALISNKEKVLSSINDNFFKREKPWLILGLHESIDSFVTKKEQFIEKKTEIKVKKQIDNSQNDFFTVLPDGSPDTVSLKRMLDEQMCYVCGRPAIKQSKEWKHIKNVKERPKEKIVNSKNDFSSFFGEIQVGVSGFYNSKEDIFEDIKQKRLIIKGLEQSILKKDEEEKDATTRLYENGGVIGEDQKLADQNDITAFDSAKQKKHDSQSAINETKKSIETCKLAIKKVGEDISKCNSGKIPEAYEKNKEYLIDIEEIFYQTQIRVFDKVLNKLEENSNSHFQRLTCGNNVKGGILKFKKTPNDTISLEVVDSSGNLISGQAEGFQRMKKLAIIMAIITSKRENMVFDYPLIADAPLGTYGKNFISNFFCEVPQVFGQSIILVKDLYDPDSESKITKLGEDILYKMNSGDIEGTFYVNLVDNPSVPSELVTIIKCYKN